MKKKLTMNFPPLARRWKSVFIALAFLFVGIPMFSQDADNIVVSGVVTDKATGETLTGVSIRVKGSSEGTSSDNNGAYSIHVAGGKTLVFSYLGYQAQEMQVTKSRMDVSLEEDSKVLSEIVVVGYGAMKRSDLTGSVVSVTADDMKKSVTTSLDQALQGRAAGVMVTQNSGAPGGGISVSIRGTNTFNGNEPLYVIDGIAIDGNTSSNTSVLSSINPSDIVSMEILKDASATAIYGTRAANGVVMITTKRGQAGKTKVTYEGYFGAQQLPRQLNVLNLREYAEYQNLRAEVLGWGAREEFADPSLLGDGTNWQDEIFRTSLMHNHQISLSGGSDATRFALSGGFLNQEGIAIGSNFERYSLRMNIDTKVSKWLLMGVNAYAARTKQINTIDNANIISTAILQLPEVPVRNPDGSYGVQQENMYGTYFSNPVAEALLRENYTKGTQLNVNAFADIAFYKDLIFRIEGNGSFNYGNDYHYTPKHDFGYNTQQSSGSRSANNGYHMTLKTYLTYAKTFNELHNLSAMAGHEAQESGWESLSGSRTGYLQNSVHELDAGDALTAKNGSSKGSYAIESYFGRFNYGFDDRYLLTATLRKDGSSSFGSNNRWATFPSLAVAWKIKNERFMKDLTAIDNLKLRLGWGVVGNQSAGSYAYGVTMASAATIWGTGFYH